ncbi:MAG: hypothetical protein KDA20_04070 [Phycisphaerales bacterium]|nr:hypothetical protein [Phycisphaerales bacterium]
MRFATRHQHNTRLGLTILEVIASLAMLSGVASGVMGALSFMERAQERDRIRLAGHEAAHRLILQYLDTPSSVYNQHDPVEVQGLQFDFAFQVAELTGSEDQGVSTDVRTARTRDGLPALGDLDTLLKTQLEQVTVRVWLNEPRAGYRAGEPIADLVRVYDIARDMDRLMEILLEAVKRPRDNQ